MAEHDASDKLREEIARRVRRHRPDREPERVWFSLGLMGIVGWSVTAPTLAGIALGLWIDRHWPSRVSWTLTLLLLGVVIGGVNAWYWVRHEGMRRAGAGTPSDAEPGA